MASLTTLLLPFLALLSFVLAQDLPSVMNGSVFVYQGKEEQFGPPSHHRSSDPRIVFALNADSSTGDLYFHLESPKDNQWVGVGIGSQMKDALFLIAYPSSNGTGVTISGRTASGDSEPSALDDIVIDKIYDEGLTDANTVTGGGANDDGDGNIVVDAVCRKCANYGNGIASIDFQDTKQPFIYAIGPPLWLESDSVNAGLEAHILYGSFSMDMTATTSDDSASVPQGPYSMSDSTTLNSAKEYNDPGARIHGIIMCISFVLILPFGALAVRIWGVKVHLIMQTIGYVLIIMATAGGIVQSGKYNKSKNFTGGHQILGIVLLIGMTVQWVLGYLNHRKFKKTGTGTVMGKVHRYLGPAIIFLGWINGGLGFRFAGVYFLSIPYGILIILVIIIIVLIHIFWIRRRAKRAQSGRAPPGMPPFGAHGGGGPALSQQQDGYYPARGDNIETPPPSDAPPAYNQSIHLQQYPSTQSLPHASGQPVVARTMV